MYPSIHLNARVVYEVDKRPCRITFSFIHLDIVLQDRIANWSVTC